MPGRQFSLNPFKKQRRRASVQAPDLQPLTSTEGVGVASTSGPTGTARSAGLFWKLPMLAVATVALGAVACGPTDPMPEVDFSRTMKLQAEDCAYQTAPSSARRAGDYVDAQAAAAAHVNEAYANDPQGLSAEKEKEICASLAPLNTELQAIAKEGKALKQKWLEGGLSSDQKEQLKQDLTEVAEQFMNANELAGLELTALNANDPPVPTDGPQRDIHAAVEDVVGAGDEEVAEKIPALMKEQKELSVDLAKADKQATYRADVLDLHTWDLKSGGQAVTDQHGGAEKKARAQLAESTKSANTLHGLDQTATKTIREGIHRHLYATHAEYQAAYDQLPYTSQAANKLNAAVDVGSYAHTLAEWTVIPAMENRNDHADDYWAWSDEYDALEYEWYASGCDGLEPPAYCNDISYEMNTALSNMNSAEFNHNMQQITVSSYAPSLQAKARTYNDTANQAEGALINAGYSPPNLGGVHEWIRPYNGLFGLPSYDVLDAYQISDDLAYDLPTTRVWANSLTAEANSQQSLINNVFNAKYNELIKKAG